MPTSSPVWSLNQIEIDSGIQNRFRHISSRSSDGGVFGEKPWRRIPDFDSREDRLINIEDIVDSYAYLYREQPNAWSFELDLRTSFETW